MMIRAVVFALLATAVAFGCEDAVTSRLSDGNEVVKISLSTIDGGSEIRACMRATSTRDPMPTADWYLVSDQEADEYLAAARLHYATSNTRYNLPPVGSYQREAGLSGFEIEFTVSDEQANDAGNRFAVILHGGSECFGSGNACTFETSVHEITRPAAWVLIVLLLIVVLICACIIGCIIYCCRRNSANQQQQQQQQMQNGQEMQQYQVEGQVVQDGQYPPQQQSYLAQGQQQPQAQPGGYPPQQQQQPGGYGHDVDAHPAYPETQQV